MAQHSPVPRPSAARSLKAPVDAITPLTSTSRSTQPVQRETTCACGGGCPRCQANPTGSVGAALQSLDTTKEIATTPNGISIPAVVQESIGSSGSALKQETRAQMEARFGFDFSDVRIHTGPQAAHSASALSAQAFTVGKDIVFGRNQYSPTSASGLKLVAHELAHVVQQRGKTGAFPKTINTTGEHEAASASETVATGHNAQVKSVSPLGIQRATQSLSQAKQSVLEELHRDMPVAILSMLDFMDAPIRAQLQQDPDVLAAIQGLPKGAQAIVMKHLMRAAPASGAAQTPAQPKPAEQIPTTTSSDYESFGLHAENAQQAVTIFSQTDVANRLVNWLAKNNIQFNVVFLARRKNLPNGKGEGGGVDGTFEQRGKKFTIYVMGSNVTMAKDWTTNDDPTDRNSEAMAKTIFHELLHVWFINAAKLGPDDPFRTGHTADVQPPSIGPTGRTNYDEANYDPQFLAKLKEFDAELAAQKQKSQRP